MTSTRLKYVAALAAGGTPPVGDPAMWDDMDGIPWVSIGDVTRGTRIIETNRGVSSLGRASKRLPLGSPGTVLFAMYASVGTIGTLAITATWNQALVGIEAHPEIADSRFIAYWLEHLRPTFSALFRTNTQENLNAEQVGNLPFPEVPLDEQRRIADFLDTETTHIDGLVDARTRQIDVLEERTLGVLAEQIAGRDAFGERVSTGWQSMPEIPAAWTVGPVFAYFDVRLGKMLNPERATGLHQRPYLRNANVHWYAGDADDLSEMSFAPDERARYRVERGDLLVCEGGAGVAEAGVWASEVDEVYFQKSLHRCRATTDLPVEWLMYWLRLAKHAGTFAADGNLATIPHLTGDQLGSYRIPIPNDAPRRLAAIESSLASASAAADVLARSIDLLRERRQVLITAAVTGQLDVTTASGETP
jgi:type I restriction enzyme S subunit